MPLHASNDGSFAREISMCISGGRIGRRLAYSLGTRPGNCEGVPVTNTFCAVIVSLQPRNSSFNVPQRAGPCHDQGNGPTHFEELLPVPQNLRPPCQDRTMPRTHAIS